MAITSFGYDGTLSELPWAQMSELMGFTPIVVGSGDFAVTARTGVDRTVRVAAGSAWGEGVFDKSDAFIDIALPVVTGSPKWTTIVIHRDWSGTAGTTTVIPILGGTTKAVAAGLNNIPGVLHDTPIALVRVSAGVQVPDGGSTGTQPIDKRVTKAQARSGWGPWTDLPHGSNWISPGAAGGHTAGYCISVDGTRVKLRGTMQAADGHIDNQAPVGDAVSAIAPSATETHIGSSESVQTSATTGGGNIFYSYNTRLDMDTTGQITATTTSGPLWLKLDGWSYDL